MSAPSDRPPAQHEWEGTGTRKGARVHYTSFRVFGPSLRPVRAHVGDLVYLAAPPGNPPYLALIEDLYQARSEKIMRTRWFYRYSDIDPRIRPPTALPHEVFLSDVEDDNTLESFAGHAPIWFLPDTVELRGKLAHPRRRSELLSDYDAFLCRSTFAPARKAFTPLDIKVLPTKQIVSKGHPLVSEAPTSDPTEELPNRKPHRDSDEERRGRQRTARRSASDDGHSTGNDAAAMASAASGSRASRSRHRGHRTGADVESSSDEAVSDSESDRATRSARSEARVPSRGLREGTSCARGKVARDCADKGYLRVVEADDSSEPAMRSERKAAHNHARMAATATPAATSDRDDASESGRRRGSASSQRRGNRKQTSSKPERRPDDGYDEDGDDGHASESDEGSIDGTDGGGGNDLTRASGEADRRSGKAAHPLQNEGVDDASDSDGSGGSVNSQLTGSAVKSASRSARSRIDSSARSRRLAREKATSPAPVAGTGHDSAESRRRSSSSHGDRSVTSAVDAFAAVAATEGHASEASSEPFSHSASGVPMENARASSGNAIASIAPTGADLHASSVRPGSEPHLPPLVVEPRRFDVVSRRDLRFPSKAVVEAISLVGQKEPRVGFQYQVEENAIPEVGVNKSEGEEGPILFSVWDPACVKHDLLSVDNFLAAVRRVTRYAHVGMRVGALHPDRRRMFPGVVTSVTGCAVLGRLRAHIAGATETQEVPVVWWPQGTVVPDGARDDSGSTSHRSRTPVDVSTARHPSSSLMILFDDMDTPDVVAHSHVQLLSVFETVTSERALRTLSRMTGHFREALEAVAAEHLRVLVARGIAVSDVVRDAIVHQVQSMMEELPEVHGPPLPPAWRSGLSVRSTLRSASRERPPAGVWAPDPGIRDVDSWWSVAPPSRPSTSLHSSSMHAGGIVEGHPSSLSGTVASVSHAATGSAVGSTDLVVVDSSVADIAADILIGVKGRTGEAVTDASRAAPPPSAAFSLHQRLVTSLRVLPPGWTAEDGLGFAQGFNRFGKLFHQVARRVPAVSARKVREVVAFFYQFKYKRSAQQAPEVATLEQGLAEARVDGWSRKRSRLLVHAGHTFALARSQSPPFGARTAASSGISRPTVSSAAINPEFATDDRRTDAPPTIPSDEEGSEAQQAESGSSDDEQSDLEDDAASATDLHAGNQRAMSPTSDESAGREQTRSALHGPDDEPHISASPRAGSHAAHSLATSAVLRDPISPSSTDDEQEEDGGPDVSTAAFPTAHHPARAPGSALPASSSASASSSTSSPSPESEEVHGEEEPMPAPRRRLPRRNARLVTALQGDALSMAAKSGLRWCSYCRTVQSIVQICASERCSYTMCERCFRGKINALKRPARASWRLAQENRWWLCLNCCPPMPSAEDVVIAQSSLDSIVVRATQCAKEFEAKDTSQLTAVESGLVALGALILSQSPVARAAAERGAADISASVAASRLRRSARTPARLVNEDDVVFGMDRPVSLLRDVLQPPRSQGSSAGGRSGGGTESFASTGQGRGRTKRTIYEAYSGSSSSHDPSSIPANSAQRPRPAWGGGGAGGSSTFHSRSLGVKGGHYAASGRHFDPEDDVDSADERFVSSSKVTLPRPPVAITPRRLDRAGPLPSHAGYHQIPHSMGWTSGPGMHPGYAAPMAAPVAPPMTMANAMAYGGVPVAPSIQGPMFMGGGMIGMTPMGHPGAPYGSLVAHDPSMGMIFGNGFPQPMMHPAMMMSRAASVQVSPVYWAPGAPNMQYLIGSQYPFGYASAPSLAMGAVPRAQIHYFDSSPAEAVSGPPQAGRQADDSGGGQESSDEATSFLAQVRREFESRPESFQELVRCLDEFQRGTLPAEELVRRMLHALRGGSRSILLQLQRFVPPMHRSLVERAMVDAP